MEDDKLRIHIMSEHGEPIDLKSLIRVLNRVNRLFDNFMREKMCYFQEENKLDKNYLNKESCKIVVSSVENGSILIILEIISKVAGIVVPLVGEFLKFIKDRRNNKKSKDSLTINNNQMYITINNFCVESDDSSDNSNNKKDI